MTNYNLKRWVRFIRKIDKEIREHILIVRIIVILYCIFVLFLWEFWGKEQIYYICCCETWQNKICWESKKPCDFSFCGDTHNFQRNPDQNLSDPPTGRGNVSLNDSLLAVS